MTSGDDRYDVVLYGATGITGRKIFETLVTCGRFEGYSVAVAGRNEQKMRDVLRTVEKTTQRSLDHIGILLCDSCNESSMAAMASRAKLIVNAVGPFRLHGEAVVRAAVENGANQIDVSGEPEWIERMEDKYGEIAKRNGVYVVSACGWDSIPADLGVSLLKRHFDGDLSRIEAFVQLHFGPSGYSISATTLHTLMLGFNGAAVPRNDLGAIRRRIMPERLDWRTDGHLPERPILSKIEEAESAGWAMPFLGADKSIVTRSRYYEAVREGVKPVKFSPYLRFETRRNAFLLALFMSVLKIVSKYEVGQRFVMRYPSLSSCNLFSEEGPTEEQMREASFTYKFYGYGYDRGDSLEEAPKKKLVVTCTGPDVGYIATSGCVLSSVLVFLKEKHALPKSGGVYTTAVAFGNSRIRNFLHDFGIKFHIEMPSKL